jgi:hypothetical protein
MVIRDIAQFIGRGVSWILVLLPMARIGQPGPEIKNRCATARGQLASLDMRAVTWAHAHAHVAGWVTFFVMGFAYQAIPRFKFTTLWQPLLASRSLLVMAVGAHIADAGGPLGR